MKTPKFILAIAVFALATSCVDQEYDLTQIDREITVLPNLEIPVDGILEESGIDLSTESLFDFTLTEDLVTNDEGTLVTKTKETEPVAVAVSKNDVENGVTLDKSIPISFGDVPEFITNPDSKILFETIPVSVIIENPLDGPVSVSADIVFDGKRKKIEWDLLQKEGPQEAIFDIANDINHLPSEICVENFHLKKIGSKAAPSITAAETYTFMLNASALVPISIRPGSVFDYVVEVNDLNLEIAALPADIIGLSEISLKGTVTSGMPVSIEGTVVEPDNGLTGSISRIAAFAKDQEFVVSAKAPNGLGTIKTLIITLTISNDTDKVANFTNEFPISFTIDSMSIPSGITIK